MTTKWSSTLYLGIFTFLLGSLGSYKYTLMTSTRDAPSWRRIPILPLCVATFSSGQANQVSRHGKVISRSRRYIKWGSSGLVMKGAMPNLYTKCGITEEEVDNCIKNRFRELGLRLLDDVHQPDKMKIYMYAMNALKDGPKRSRILRILEMKE